MSVGRLGLGIHEFRHLHLQRVFTANTGLNNYLHDEVFLEKCIVASIQKMSLILFRKVITVFTIALNVPSPEPDESSPQHNTSFHFFKINFNNILPSMPRSSHYIFPKVRLLFYYVQMNYFHIQNGCSNCFLVQNSLNWLHFALS
jgi:hypothetical protein